MVFVVSRASEALVRRARLWGPTGAVGPDRGAHRSRAHTCVERKLRGSRIIRPRLGPKRSRPSVGAARVGAHR
ncbi:hypothetical protein B296_00047864 [Ensete ventricosum]|uniref:Uncharacterized protein n=1 Tax=Ensete ventricosum TaxID=4639 RepID=A0A426YXJ1_ENSVE|nr:hypothetical protein B296_00047864 [Ensete ventricosum]